MQRYRFLLTGLLRGGTEDTLYKDPDARGLPLDLGNCKRSREHT